MLKLIFKLKLLKSTPNDQGFTLIELLVVIIIIGILSAIALPTFLKQAYKAKETEAKQYLGALCRTQQTYYAENLSFTDDVNVLSVGISDTTQNYLYDIHDDNGFMNHVAQSRSANLRSFVCVVGLDTSASEAQTRYVMCQANVQGTTSVPTSNTLACPSNFTQIK